MNGAIGLPNINEISNDAWKNLSRKRIYFAHQSVGNNIIQGIFDIVIANYAIELSIKERVIDEESGSPVFLHSKIGENGHPIKKIDDFKNVIQDTVGKDIDIAVLKLCFWDIRKDTDINEVFTKYKCNIGELKKEYPHIKFIHCTVPLMKHTNTLIAKIKRLLNITIFSDLDNIKRNEFNELILREYGGGECIIRHSDDRVHSFGWN